MLIFLFTYLNKSFLFDNKFFYDFRVFTILIFNYFLNFNIYINM